MIINPWLEAQKEARRKKAAKAWRKKKGLIKSTENKKSNKQKKPKNVKANEFYKSWEWKRLRYEVLRERGARCECCGITAMDHPLGYVVVDHIKPASIFPALRMERTNLQILCNDCNMGKSKNYHDDWRPETATPDKHDNIRDWLDK